MRGDAPIHGAEAFFFFAPRLDAIASVRRRLHRNNIEVWFGVQFCCIDERVGYYLELSAHPSSGGPRYDSDAAEAIGCEWPGTGSPTPLG